MLQSSFRLVGDSDTTEIGIKMWRGENYLRSAERGVLTD